MAIATEILGRDSSGAVDYTLPGAKSCYDVVLSASTVATVTTPAGYNRVFFSYAPGLPVWVTLDGSTPAVPSVSGASTQELIPGGRQINVNGQTIKLISNASTYVNLRYETGP